MGKAALGKVPEAGLQREMFKPRVSYSGCLLQKEVGCARTGHQHLPDTGLAGCLSHMSKRGKEKEEDSLADPGKLSVAGGSANRSVSAMAAGQRQGGPGWWSLLGLREP